LYSQNLPDSHTDGTEEEKVTATPLLDKVETGEGGSDVDAGSNHGDDEGVVDTGVLEEGCSVVENEVDTSELLEGLEGATSEKALAQVTTEAVEVGGLAKRHLILVVGSDLSQLLNKSRVVNVEAAKGRERLGSLFWAALLDEPARSLRKPDAAGEEDDSPGELNSDRDTVGASVGPVLCGVVDDSSEEKTDGDSKLVATDNGTTNPLGSSLGLIERDGGTDHTNTVASEETSGNEHGDGSGDGLENDTDAEDDVADNKSEAATEEISSGCCGESTEEGTGREDRDDQGGLLGGDIEHVVLLVDVASAEKLSPVVHSKNATNGTSIITILVSRTLEEGSSLHTRTKHHQRQRTGRPRWRARSSQLRPQASSASDP